MNWGDLLIRVGRLIKENFTPLALVGLFLIVLGFIAVEAKVHNDVLAQKGTAWGDAIIGAILLASRGVRSSGGSQP